MEHHVYFWLKEEHQNDGDRAAFERALDDLFDIDTVDGGLWSVPAKVEARPVCDQSWDYAISMRFETLEDHNTYQVDPAHEAFIGKFKSWWSKVLVTDLA